MIRCIAILRDPLGRAIATELLSILLAQGLRSEIAARYVVAALLAKCETGSAPRIVSGYRSPEAQEKLRRKWAAGERAGIVAPPAQESWHTKGLAIDVTTKGRGFEVFREAMLIMGSRWGGNFSTYDPVHFDYPTR